MRTFLIVRADTARHCPHRNINLSCVVPGKDHAIGIFPTGPVARAG